MSDSKLFNEILKEINDTLKDFKLELAIVQERIRILEAESAKLKANK
jgi:hypothetical protein